MGTSAYGYYFKTRKEFKTFIENDRLGIKQKYPEQSGCYGYELSNLLLKYDYDVKVDSIDTLLTKNEITEIYDDIKYGEESPSTILIIKNILEIMNLHKYEYVYFGNFYNCYY